MNQPPIAPTEHHVRELHGVTTEDPWFWMRNVDDARLAELVEAENAYTEAVAAPQADLRQTLFDEIKARVQETDMSVPARRGSWWYQTRTVEGLAYPIHVRIADDGSQTPPADHADAQTILDENVLAEGHDYSQVGAAAVSPDGSLLAWSVDHTGDEAYTLHIRDLDTGGDRAEIVEGTSYGLAWSADSTWVFYTTLDATQRPDRVWRHALGTDQSADTVVFAEDDERYFVHVDANRSDDWILISSQSAVTGEVHLLDAHDPTGELGCVARRRQGVEVSVEAHRDRLYVLTNADGAEDFALFSVDAHDLEADWEPVIPHTRGVRLDGCDAFENHLVVHVRQNGVTGLRIIDLGDGTARDVELPEVVGTVSPGANPEFSTATYQFAYQSLVTPPSVFTDDLVTGARTLLKQLTVRGGYDPAVYTSTRIWVDADDGSPVPVSLVHRVDTPLDGSAPCLLYGYGAYEISIDPWFSIPRLSLLDRGWVYAIAHVRGGGEMGRHWYTEGKFAAKPNSFTDFVACAHHLFDGGYTAADRVVIRGGSAGGLLVGAAMNLAPDSFAAAIAEVPFVDPLNTLCDPS
ncbi:MAG TPA: S9 family peptidase, partial [Acidimicrobiales bacterium]|nr:S9 family peptidase [Acidimicrobiales bacterium]